MSRVHVVIALFLTVVVVGCGEIVPNETEPDSAVALCGNGAIDVGETCDPPESCPQSCASEDACTAADLVGDPLACTAECALTPVEVCVSGDGCCPASCTLLTDSDCVAAALIVTPNSFPDHSADIQMKQLATGAFTAVDLWDATALGVPTLNDLLAYDVVFLYSAVTWPDPVGLGDVVADYFDGGGRVVQALFNVSDFSPLGGRWGDPAQGYGVIEPLASDPALMPDTLGVIREPMSPLMVGVNTLSCPSAYRTIGGPLPGATVVAEWAAGFPLVVRGSVNGRNRVDINMYPASGEVPNNFGFWSGDGAEIIRNALLFR